MRQEDVPGPSVSNRRTKWHRRLMRYGKGPLRGSFPDEGVLVSTTDAFSSSKVVRCGTGARMIARGDSEGNKRL